jgi:diguanylate cyclase (GGDEF)-like protein/PAS domain S-box-containing protein
MSSMHALDIEKRRLETLLEKTGPESSFFRELMDGLFDGVYLVATDRRIVYWNRGAELLSGRSADEMVGCSCHKSLLEHTDARGRRLCASHCPMLEAMRTGRPTRNMVYLRHKDGHRVAVDVQVTPIQDADGEIIGCVEVFRDATARAAIENTVAHLRELVARDPLTGIANRRHLEAMLDLHLDLLRRAGAPFSVLMLDLDHFKQVNDSLGHPAGDAALQEVARRLQVMSRSADTAGRYGGEEFLVLLPREPLGRAGRIAERIRHGIQGTTVTTPAGSTRVTVSIGVTEARATDSRESLIARVDAALYQAKAGGRNQVVADPHTDSPEPPSTLP